MSLPKPPGLRQRRNRVATRAILPSVEESQKRKVPPLYKRESSAEKWHPKVLGWWRALWKSPMAEEYLEAEIRGGLYDLAELYQAFWTSKNVRDTIAVASEIRQQEARFGLSPVDRRRLQWEVERGEQAVERAQRRRRNKNLERLAGTDPREFMRLIHEPGSKHAEKAKVSGGENG
jgi:hypothetical protein